LVLTRRRLDLGKAMQGIGVVGIDCECGVRLFDPHHQIAALITFPRIGSMTTGSID